MPRAIRGYFFSNYRGAKETDKQALIAPFQTTRPETWDKFKIVRTLHITSTLLFYPSQQQHHHQGSLFPSLLHGAFLKWHVFFLCSLLLRWSTYTALLLLLPCQAMPSFITSKPPARQFTEKIIMLHILFSTIHEAPWDVFKILSTPPPQQLLISIIPLDHATAIGTTNHWLLPLLPCSVPDWFFPSVLVFCGCRLARPIQQRVLFHVLAAYPRLILFFIKSLYVYHACNSPSKSRIMRILPVSSCSSFASSSSCVVLSW